MNKLKILIVDDEKLIREGLKIILETYGDIEVMDMAEDGFAALEALRRQPVDLVLMDIRMPKCDGVEATRLIRREFQAVKILILTTFSDTEYIRQAMKFGASGYLLKDSDYDLIHEGIKAAVLGHVVVHPDVADKLLAQTSQPKKDFSNLDLTDKEIELIRKVAQGLSNKEIAESLYLSEGTIKNQISHLFTKLDLRDRTQLTIFAYKQGIAD